MRREKHCNKRIIHSCDKRLWYVCEFLVPVLRTQGIEPEIHNDYEHHRGNLGLPQSDLRLRSCMRIAARSVALVHVVRYADNPVRFRPSV